MTTLNQARIDAFGQKMVETLNPADVAQSCLAAVGGKEFV